MKRITASFNIYVTDETDEDVAYGIIHLAIDDMLKHENVEEVELDDYNSSEIE